MVDRYLDAMLDENANEDELWDLMNERRKSLREAYYADMFALVELRQNEKQNGKEKRTMVLSDTEKTDFEAPSGAAPPPASCLTQTADAKVEVRQLSSPILMFSTKDPCCLSSAGIPNPENSDSVRAQQCDWEVREQTTEERESSHPPDPGKPPTEEWENSYPPDPGKPHLPPPAVDIRRRDGSHDSDPPDPGG